MASLELRHKTYRVVFMLGGRKHGFSLDTSDRQTAEALRGGVEKTLMLIGQGLLKVPKDTDVAAFVRAGGQTEHQVSPGLARLSLATFKQQYLDTHRDGAMEANSLATVAMHLGHFERTLGERFTLQQLSLADLQRHVSERAKKKYRGKPLSPVTLKKEMASFRAAWNWATLTGLVHGPFPSKGLVYPKGDEKRPFMTWAEIEKRAVGLPERERDELWDCLFLTQFEITELLDHARQVGGHGWIYPAITFAAHTGARRSEVIRVRLQDLNLDDGTVVIREKKRSRSKRTHRRVPLSPLLTSVLRDWLTRHPGGPFLFRHESVVGRSKKRSQTTGHQWGEKRETSLKGRMKSVSQRKAPAASALTRDEAHDHFQRTIAGSKWEVLRGWHVLRHSFISNCAAQGVDQRLIDAWVGHQTEEMRKRYRHLIPSTEQVAIRTVFGE